MAECHVNFDTHTHTSFEIGGYLDYYSHCERFMSAEMLQLQGFVVFAEQVLSSWPSRHVPWPVADVRIPNAILILIGICSFGPGVPGQSAQLLLLEGIGHVWLFFRASLHDLKNVFKVQALPNQVLKCDLTLANVDMWDTSTDLRLNAAEAWRVTDSESQTQTLCPTHSVRSVVGGPGLALTTACQLSIDIVSVI